MDDMGFEQRLADIRRRIDAAARESGRRGEDIILVGASKMNDADRVRAAIKAGLRVCGENRVQELRDKLAQNAYEGAELHFIGTLQKNKVKYVVGNCALIHSVDSVALMEEIDTQAKKRGVVQDVLLEINVGAEESKSGIAPAQTAEILAAAADFGALRVRGLMAIPPASASAEENLSFFHIMEKLFIDNGKKKYDNVCMDFLSMGMSGDFESAIRCGANMVRIGTAIFGARSYPAP